MVRGSIFLCRQVESWYKLKPCSAVLILVWIIAYRKQHLLLKTVFLVFGILKRDTVGFGTTLTWTLVFSLWKSSPQPEVKVHLEIRFNLRSVLLDFQSLTEKPVFECAFAHPMILCLSYLVKNSVHRVSVICKLAMKWYLKRMCASWLCLFSF